MKMILLLTTMVPVLAMCQAEKSIPLIVDRGQKFNIKNEGKVIKFTFGNPDYIRYDTVAAQLTVNDDPVREIHFTKANLHNDTLSILITSTSPAYHQVYKIEIVKDKCQASYSFRPSGPDYETNVIPVDFSVTLNRSDFTPGGEIRGHTEFRGRCEGKGCYDEKVINLKGNFKVKILK